MHFEIAPNEEPRREHPSRQGPLKNAMVSTREGALEWMKDKILNGPRQEDALQMEHVEGAMACISRAEPQWPGVSTKRYGELRELHQLLMNRSRWAKESVEERNRASWRRASGYRRKGVQEGTLSMRKPLKLQRLAEGRKRNAPDDDTQAKYWAVVERNEGRATKT